MDEQASILAISQLISLERHWRDVGQWEKMRSAYHPESVVRVSWFQGTGFEFVEASQRTYRPGKSKHHLSPPLIRLHGDRGLVEASAVIELRAPVEDIEVDIFANCRFLSRVRRDEGTWGLTSLDAIYEKDRIAPVNPSDQVPINREELDQYRPTYRFLSYILRGLGRKIDSNLPGEDRPELVAALYAEAEDWLMKQ